MTLTTLLAVTASVLAVGLLVASSEPFARAFARQHGAHLAAQFDAGKATAEQLSATAHAAGVTAAAGPFPMIALQPRTVTQREFAPPPGIDLPSMTIVGRPDQGSDIDRLELSAGRWATGPGEMVIAGVGEGRRGPFAVGDELQFPAAPGAPTLKVVGLARSVGQTAEAWALPATVTALAGSNPAGFQMLYRFTTADTDADLVADRNVIAAAVPKDALLGTSSYLQVKTHAERVAATFAPFVVAFGVLGLIMSVLIIGIVVSGAVSSATRRIGILKALGYSPAQVARAYVGQALIPATVGALLGIPLGNLAAVPVLAQEGNAFGTGAVTLDWWVSVVVPLAALAAVVATAFVPALRAGRLRTVDALAVGRTPSLGRGRRARHLIGRLPMPRAMSLGLATPFTRPGRSATIAAAVALGALGVTFGIGLALSVGGVQTALNRRDAGDVIVYQAGPVDPSRVPPGAEPPKPDPAAVEAAIKAQPGTARYFASNQGEISVAGITGATEIVTFDGDASWGTYEVVDGRWFSGPGEAVVPTGFLKITGSRIGDSITLSNAGHTATVRIVGEVMDLSNDGRRVVTDARSVAGLQLKDSFGGGEYHVDLADGTDVAAWIAAVNAKIRDSGGEAQLNVGEISSTVVAMDSLAGTLTLLLVAVAGLGVLNTVVLETRERVHELGVFKALGMAPRQTVAMVLTSVAGIGLLAGLVGVPAGIAVHDWILPRMGRAAGTRFPPHILQVYSPLLLSGLFLGGLVIAVAGALLPAGWAARTSTARALRTE